MATTGVSGATIGPHLLSLSLLLPYGVQPGLSFDAMTPVAEVGPSHRLVVDLRASVFTHAGSHTSGQLGGEFGIHLGANHPVSQVLSLGPHGQLTSELQGRSIGLAQGDSESDRAWRGYAVPLVRYRLIHQPGERWGWSLGGAGGHQWSPTHPSALHFALDLGLVMRLGDKP
ncbi:MAG: hypothetical protein KDA24_26000 [Deltaproteobacteria bacterium]|nr:hypothetical protein [Deltaproteobacteria bacterium]